jgi:hypothetical protein
MGLHATATDTSDSYFVIPEAGGRNVLTQHGAQPQVPTMRTLGSISRRPYPRRAKSSHKSEHSCVKQQVACR